MVKTPIQGQKPEAAEAPSPSIPAVEARVPLSSTRSGSATAPRMWRQN